MRWDMRGTCQHMKFRLRGDVYKMQIKYWMYQPEQMLVVRLPEERKQDKCHITMILLAAYATWSNPEEDYDDEDVIEAIYDSECAQFIISEAHKELGYQLEYTVENSSDEHDADYILDSM